MLTRLRHTSSVLAQDVTCSITSSALPLRWVVQFGFLGGKPFPGTVHGSYFTLALHYIISHPFCGSRVDIDLFTGEDKMTDGFDLRAGEYGIDFLSVASGTVNITVENKYKGKF